jgi:hypothetical protein
MNTTTSVGWTPPAPGSMLARRYDLADRETELELLAALAEQSDTAAERCEVAAKRLDERLPTPGEVIRRNLAATWLNMRRNVTVCALLASGFTCAVYAGAVLSGSDPLIGIPVALGCGLLCYQSSRYLKRLDLEISLGPRYESHCRRQEASALRAEHRALRERIEPFQQVYAMVGSDGTLAGTGGSMVGSGDGGAVIEVGGAVLIGGIRLRSKKQRSSMI